MQRHAVAASRLAHRARRLGRVRRAWLTTRYVSLGSVAAAVSLPFTTYFVFHNTACTVLGTCISLLVLWAHRSNIKRLLSGTESKFHFHVNAPKPGEDE